MFGLFGSAGRPGLLTGTLKAVAAITVLSVLATKYLSDRSLNDGALTRLASQATGETTGSILPSGNAVRLDPCAKR